MTTNHQEDQCNKSVEGRSEIENHKQITHSAISFEEILINNPDVVVIKLCQNSSHDKEICVDSHDLPKHLCNVCLLSFQTEDILKQHVSEHEENIKSPSILKKF